MLVIMSAPASSISLSTPLICAVACLLLCPVVLTVPIAETKLGNARGTKLACRDTSRTVFAFLGIPYAQPPVGDLRLAPPEPALPWAGEWDATAYGPMCPQIEALMEPAMHPFVLRQSGSSEDCLHLDVYTPDVNGMRAVMVFIHGGGLQFGKSNMADGTAIAAHEDIVFVAMNYRLGALGFLYDADGAWPCNLGLRDQQLALRWVRDNIAAFGGDPDRITLAGESTGASSVSAHILAPSSHGLFHRAIQQSGSVFAISNRSHPAQVGKKYVANLGCDSSYPEDTVSCIRGKSVDDILGAQLGLHEHMGDLTMTFDGSFLPADLRQAYSQSNFSKVDYLTGVTSNAGFVLGSTIIPEMTSEDINYRKCKQQIHHFLSGFYSRNLEDITDAVIQFYIGKEIHSRGYDAKAYNFVRKRLAEMSGELLVHAPTHLAAQLHAGDVSNVYFYELSHRPRFISQFRPSWHYGCDHGHDLLFTLGYTLLNDILVDDAEFTSDEIDFSKTLMKYWANFAKNGNPNGDDLDKWLSYDAAEENYLILQPRILTSRRFKTDRMAFWNSKLRHLERRNASHRPHDEL